MQPNIHFIIFQEKYPLHSAHYSFFGPSLFWPGIKGRSVAPARALRLISFLPLSLSSPDSAAAKARGRRRRGALAGAERGSGAAELCSPEVCAAMAGAQLGRASLVGALRRLLPRARDPSDPWRRRQGVRSGRWPAFRERSAHGRGWQHAVVAGPLSVHLPCLGRQSRRRQGWPPRP